MKKWNSLHLDIANVLMDCAEKKKTVCYSDLCDRLGLSRRNIGEEIEKVSLLTYERYEIFISVLVVLKETQDNNPMPSSGFYPMYSRKCGKPSNFDEVIKTQQEKAFAQDWSDLPDLIQCKITNA